jgi:hypothetical protein
VAGTILNVLGILFGGMAGWLRRTPLSTASQGFFKLALGLATIVLGLRLTWLSVGGTVPQVLGQIGVVLLAMMLGKLLGGLLRLQQLSNRLGRFTREQLDADPARQPRRVSDAFNASAAVFCAAPLGLLGAVTDGLGGHWQPLALKAVMDGLAAMGFVAMFHAGGVLLSALPVLAFQGTIALVCRFWIEPWLAGLHLVDPVNATAGLLMCAVALVIFEVKRIELAGYLPSLLIAPMLTWLFRALG